VRQLCVALGGCERLRGLDPVHRELLVLLLGHPRDDHPAAHSRSTIRADPPAKGQGRGAGDRWSLRRSSRSIERGCGRTGWNGRRAWPVACLRSRCRLNRGPQQSGLVDEPLAEDGLLERDRLWLANFDPTVRRVASQPHSSTPYISNRWWTRWCRQRGKDPARVPPCRRHGCSGIPTSPRDPHPGRAWIRVIWRCWHQSALRVGFEPGYVRIQ